MIAPLHHVFDDFTAEWAAQKVAEKRAERSVDFTAE